MEAAIVAHLDITQYYDLLLNGTALSDDLTVASAKLNSSSPLSLRPNLSKKHSTWAFDSQAVLKSAFQAIVPGSTVIVTDSTLQQLKDQGFSRHILDPIMFYKMNLMYGLEGNAKTGGNQITLNVEVVSWGSLKLNIDRRLTVLQMKQMLAAKIKIDESMQSIIFNGQSLTDSSTLESCGLANGYTVILTCTGVGSYLFLPLEYFDSAGDNDYTEYTSPPDFGKRGGEDYFPPCGWRRIGLKVTGRFENDTWLGMSNRPGEWIVSYHGTRVEAMQSIALTGYDLSKCQRFAYGKGVYSAPHIEDAEGYAIAFTWEGRDYRLAFMNRVNPASGALKKARDANPSNPDYYISTTDRDIRPYGILIKPI